MITTISFDNGTKPFAGTRFAADDVIEISVVSLTTCSLSLFLESPKPLPVSIFVGSLGFLVGSNFPATYPFGHSVKPRLVVPRRAELGWHTFIER